MDPFLLFGLEKRWDLDLVAAEKTFRALSRKVHPDRFTLPEEKRQATEKMNDLVGAWRVLKNPVLRAQALFEHYGAAEGSKPTPSFLMEMMDLEESLEGANPAHANEVLERVRHAKQKAEGEMRALFERADESEVRASAHLLGEIRFLERLEQSASEALEEPSHAV